MNGDKAVKKKRKTEKGQWHEIWDVKRKSIWKSKGENGWKQEKGKGRNVNDDVVVKKNGKQKNDNDMKVRKKVYRKRMVKTFENRRKGEKGKERE